MARALSRKRIGFAVALTGMAIATGAPTASALTVGQLDPGDPSDCTGSYDLVQETLSSGNSYVVPSNGGVRSWTVTSWGTRAAADPGATMTAKFFRKVGEPASYMAVAREGPHAIAGPGGLRTFPADIRVRPGDLLGFHFDGSGGECVFDAPGPDIVRIAESDLADGGSADFPHMFGPYRANISAEIVPTSDFTLGKVRRRPNGTAVLRANVPNPGTLKANGKGVTSTSATARAALKVSAPGPVKLVIRAKGKKRAKLLETGKVTLRSKIRFRPTGGTASTEAKRIKLRLG
jgi:hypothetical protein